MSSSCELMKQARILVASASASDAEMVSEMLAAEFSNVVVSTDPQQAISDFERQQPEVLILAFNTLEQVQQYHSELLGLSQLAQTLLHRSVILCSKDELSAAYSLCRQQRFDDYVLFWPLAYDAPRLSMAVMNAWRDLQRNQGSVTTTDAACLARQIAELEGRLASLRDQGSLQAQAVGRSVLHATAQINLAVDSFAKKIMSGGLADALVIRDSARLQHEFDQLKTQGVQPSLKALRNELQPLMLWVKDMQGQRDSRLASAQAMAERAENFQPLVLIVDDSEFERKLMGQLLAETFYELIFAASGAEALGLLGKRLPNLILMNLDMPDLNGLETLRRIKASVRFASTPVMMVTGHSDKGMVVDCLRAGAVDFVVKPLDREPFLNKLDRFLA